MDGWVDTEGRGHSPDCDGFRSTHNQTTERMPDYPNIRRLVCDIDGPVTSFCGPGVTPASLQRMATCHPAEEPCDGRCVR